MRFRFPIIAGLVGVPLFGAAQERALEERMQEIEAS